jgi:hypothetical protein
MADIVSNPSFNGVFAIPEGGIQIMTVSKYESIRCLLKKNFMLLRDLEFF